MIVIIHQPEEIKTFASTKDINIKNNDDDQYLFYL